MSIGRIIPLCAVVLSLPLGARGEVAVRFVQGSASLFIHEPFTLRMDVESDDPPEPPTFPAVPGLAVGAIRALPSDPTRRQHGFELGLIAERDGILIVPPFAVRAGDETALTPALRLRISAPRPASEMALAITVEPAALRVGQPAAVTVTWTSAVPFERCKELLFEIPLLADEHCGVFPLDPPVPEAERMGLPVNSLRVVAQAGSLRDKRRYLRFRYALIPHEPCVLHAQPARLMCALVKGKHSPGQVQNYFYNQFFVPPDDNEAYERIYLTSVVPEITVRALPEKGRSARFAEIVGPCALHTTVAPVHLVVGQPALFTVQLDKMVFARQLTGLPPAAWDGLRPEFQLSAEPIRESAGDTTHSFTRILRPLRAGISSIPAVVIQTFDPARGEYQTLRSVPIPISVEADREGSARAVAPRIDSKPPVGLNGIRHNRVEEQAMISMGNMWEMLGRYWWALVPLPPLVWLALVPLIRRRERGRRDPVYARATAALGRFRRMAWRDEEAAWRNYLADRLALCAEALTADTVAEALHARKVDDTLVAEARQRFEEKDAAEYGRRPAPPRRSTRNLVRRLQKATAPLLLLCSVFICADGYAADSPDELFARAQRMREQKPDEAQPMFVEAALGFEAAGRLLNAGNSWFFAGESGRALANYLSAQRRWPFDRQLRESIEFVRANRSDAFPPPASPAGRVAAFWKQFCTWATVLRVGLFVLAYCLAWIIFLAAQLAGWRIRRAVWAALAVMVLVPLVSVAQTSVEPAHGVVVEDAVARLGPGYGYDPAFEQALHKATEFSWMESRQGWVRARLPDASEGWLRESDCMKVE